MQKVAVSILSVEPENAVSLFYNLETAKPDYFHVDVMDGKFVEKNNLAVMQEYALTLSHISSTPLDVHLMVEDVEKVMDDYIPLAPDRLTFHLEAVSEEARILQIMQDLKENGVKVGIAINPATDWRKLTKFLPQLHQVLVMTVVAGKGGQKLLPETLVKIKELKAYCKAQQLELQIEADGGINGETAEAVREAGADILVSGSYVVGAENFAANVKKLKGE